MSDEFGPSTFLSCAGLL